MHSSKTKKEATSLGRKLVKKLDGKGWRLRVHENLGWHYNVWKGPISINASFNPRGKKTTYSVLISSSDERPPVGGLVLWTSNDTSRASHKDPNVAVRRAVKYARLVIDRLSAQLREAEEAVPVETTHSS